MSWGCPDMFKSRSGMDVVSKYENLSYLCLGTTSLLVPEIFTFKNFETWLPATYNNNGPNISLPSYLYWYATLNSCKYWKSETNLRNAQVNKTSSVNKGIVKTCLIVDIVRKNCSWIVVAACGLHYCVPARFVSFWVVANFSTAERFKYLFFKAMIIHTLARTVKKQNNFIFILLVTWTCQMCFTSTVRYGIMVQAPLFNLY